MKTQTMKSAVLALVVLAPMLGSTSVLAADSKIYSPLGCVKTSTTGTITYDLGDSIANTSTIGFLTVSCPLVRDFTEKTILSGSVTVVDRSASYSVSCTLKSSAYQPNTVTPTISSGNSVSTLANLNSNTMQRLEFTGNKLPSSMVSGLSHYFYTCTLPPAVSSTVFSSIRSYHLNENN